MKTSVLITQSDLHLLSTGHILGRTTIPLSLSPETIIFAGRVEKKV
jgi:hypothetical protein